MHPKAQPLQTEAKRIWLNLELAKKPVQCLDGQKPLSLLKALTDKAFYLNFALCKGFRFRYFVRDEACLYYWKRGSASCIGGSVRCNARFAWCRNARVQPPKQQPSKSTSKDASYLKQTRCQQNKYFWIGSHKTI